MRAGFAKADITPPIGTFMLGFGARDIVKPCEGIHDPLAARVLYVEHEDEPALIVSYDLLFFARDEGERIKRAIGEALGLEPRQILLNCSHTHMGPAMGTWGFAAYRPLVDPNYVAQVEAATVGAAQSAADAAVDATLEAGEGRTSLPVSRRYINEQGGVEWRPGPDDETYDSVPVCLFRDQSGQPICLLFSVACHPSIRGDWEIGADYPGPACDALGEQLGADVAMLCQGCGGDAKPNVVADGAPDDTGRPTWREGEWDDVERAGQIVASEVMTVLNGGLHPHAPRVRTMLEDMAWPLSPLPMRDALAALRDVEGSLRTLWADREIDRIDRGETRPTHAPVMLQAIQLGQDVRIVALEGEPVAGHAHLMRTHFPDGVLLPLGYANSQGLYLPTERMLSEGGYEVESAYEYGFPAPLTYGFEDILHSTIDRFKGAGLA